AWTVEGSSARGRLQVRAPDRSDRRVLGSLRRFSTATVGHDSVTRTTACASRSTVPPVIAIYGADDETPLESLDRIAARLSNSSDREATEWFQEALAAHRQFPLQLPLP